MLQDDGRFCTPASAADLVEDARALASPVAEFVSECCELGCDDSTDRNHLWEAWKTWADKNGHPIGNRGLFGRNLRTAAGYKIKDERPGR